MLLMKKLMKGEKMYDLLLGLSQLKQKAESIYYLSYLLVLHYGSDKNHVYENYKVQQENTFLFQDIQGNIWVKI